MKNTRNLISIGYLLAFISAFLYGLSTPINKLLLLEINPLVLSGWSYFFSGLITLPSFRKKDINTSLGKKEIPKLLIIILFGSFLGPILFFFGLNLSTAFQASLFQYSEAVFTILIAFFIFNDKISKRSWIGIVLILMILLFWSINFNIFMINQIIGTGVIFILIGCACWAIDNNTTKSLGNKSSFQITAVKCIFGGIISLFLATIFNINIIVKVEFIIFIFFVGILTFGVSIICFTSALKYIGAINTITIVSLSPFIAALLSIIINKEMIEFMDIIAIMILIIGIFLLIKEKRSYMHVHSSLIHSHPFSSDTPHHDNVEIIEINSNGILHKHQEFSHSHPHSRDSEHDHSNFS